MMMISFDLTLFQISLNSQVFKTKTKKQVMNGELMTNDKDWPFADVFSKGNEDTGRPQSSSKRKRSSSNQDNPGVVTRSRSRSSSPSGLSKKKLKCLSPQKNRKTYPLTESQMSISTSPPISDADDHSPEQIPTPKKGRPSKSKPKVNTKKEIKNKKIKANQNRRKPSKEGDIVPDDSPDDSPDDVGKDREPYLQFRNGILYIYKSDNKWSPIYEIPNEFLKQSNDLYRTSPEKSVNEDWYGLKLNQNTICSEIIKNMNLFGWTRVDYDFVKRVKSRVLNKYFLNATHDAMRESEFETLLLAYKGDNGWTPTGT